VPSFIYQRRSKSVFFARDPLGRRSLLVHWPTHESPALLLASVSIGVNYGYNFTELSTEHIYALKLGSLGGDNAISFDASLECLARYPPSSYTSLPAPFVRYSFVN
jgi:hypothetical protein